MNTYSVVDIPARSDSGREVKFPCTALRPEDIAAVSGMTFPSFRPHLTRCLAGDAHDGLESLA